jgi:hypothetical protein
MRRLPLLAIVVLTGVLASGSAAATRAQVVVAAKRGTIIELHKAGLYFRPADITATCRRVQPTRGMAERWTCRIRANGGQCSGTLAVVRKPRTTALLVREFRVGCGE